MNRIESIVCDRVDRIRDYSTSMRGELRRNNISGFLTLAARVLEDSALLHGKLTEILYYKDAIRYSEED
jgi:hypothetical protein